MATTDSYLRPSTQRVLEFRTNVDRDTDARLADELELRAQMLRDTVVRPEDEREDYERVCQRVASYCYDNDWRQARIARRCWVTGEALWHAIFVLFGSADASGCQCNAPECKARREARS